MSLNYAYAYAVIGDMTNGMIFQVIDTSDYILDQAYVPIPDYNVNYMMKYYWPIPETVTSFDNFQGQFYHDAAHTQVYEP